MTSENLVIGVVGPCAAGKSTLVKELRSRGWQVRHIAQEHSYVQDMWQQIAKPDFLIYLDVSYEVSRDRSEVSLASVIYQNQLERLVHARKNADLYIDTDEKTPQQVLKLVIESIGTLG